MPTLTQYLLVAAAGAIGAVLRLFVATSSGRLFGAAFPYGTFIINITGSFILGWFMALCARPGQISETTRLAIAVGFVGSYTTFSTLMYESNALFAESLPLRAILNLVGSLIIGLLAVRLGLLVGQR